MRVQKSKTKNATSYYIVESTYVQGKRSNKVVEKLGTLQEVIEKAGGMDPDEWAKQRAKELTEEKKNNEVNRITIELLRSSESDVITKNRFNCGYLFLEDIYYKLGLHRICKDISKRYKYNYDLNEILSKLIYARMLLPSSKRSSYSYFENLIEPTTFELEDIYRSLEVLAKECDFIQKELYKNSSKVCERNTKVLYYDCTNYYFEIEEEDDFRKYGASKENRPNPIVQMGLFMDGNGLPLAFCINPGNTNEQVTMKPLEKSILKDFDISDFVVCTDAGLSSTSNRKFNAISNRSYIVTQSIKKTKAHIKEWCLDPNGWREINSKNVFNIKEIDEDKYYDTIFYKERWINENGLEQKLVVTYSVKYKEYMRSIREGQVNRAVKLVQRGANALKRKNANDCRRFIESSNYTDDGIMAENTVISIDEEAISKEAAYDGLYAVCTNLEATPEELISINRNRWEIEESFRIMKSEFKAKPVYLQRQDRIKAHFLICFISLLILRIIEEQTEHKYTVKELLSTLQDMEVSLFKDIYIPSFNSDSITNDLHKYVNFNLNKAFIPATEMRKILKDIKKQ